MIRLLPPISILVIAAALSGTSFKSLGQLIATVPEGPVLVKLSDPTYPPLARQASIIGDVNLLLNIRRDGSVESATVENGPPMLRQAAFDSAQKSQYDCGNCREQTNPYRLVYTFQLTDRENCCDLTDNLRVSQSGNHVIVSNRYVCLCDPAAKIKVRSLKCLYLWRCTWK